MPGLMPQSVDLKRKERPISIEKFLGMQSNRPVQSVDMNAFSYLLNMCYSNEAIASRKGSILHMNNSVTGVNSIIHGTPYIKENQLTGKTVFITANGKIYQRDQGSMSVPSLIGDTTNLTPTFVGMTVFDDNLYIADGEAWLKWDGTTLTDITDTLPIVDGGRGNIVDVVSTLSRVVVFTDKGWGFASVPDSDDMLTEANGAQSFTINVNDGTKVLSAFVWANNILINKGNKETRQYTMHWLKGIGTTADPFKVVHLLGDRKSPIAFLGRSAAQVGNDVIGLTPLGVTTLSAINNFQEANSDPVSEDIFNIIQSINWAQADKISGFYDSSTRQYMLAVPANGSSKVNMVLVYDTYKDRWSIFDNWTVRCWVPNRDKVLYGDESGQFIQINTGHNDMGAGYQKVADTGANAFTYPDILKLFKSFAATINHQGDYNLYVTPVVDEDSSNSKQITVPLNASGSLWDQFIWDVDAWDGDGNTYFSAYILARGKTLRLRFYNDQPDEPYTISSITYRLFQKDSGSTKD